MSLVIELPPSVESRLEAEARRSGATPEAVAAALITKSFASLEDDEQKRRNAPSIALLESWLADVSQTDAERRDAEAELVELKKNLNAARRVSGARLLFPDAE